MGGQQFKKTSPTQESSLQQLQPAVTKGTPKLKDICVSPIPQRAMKAIILEICTDTTGLLQISIYVKTTMDWIQNTERAKESLPVARNKRLAEAEQAGISKQSSWVKVDIW